jgi:KTSC domain
MRLSKIDLSSLKAIAHSDDCLALLVDRGDEIECIEIPAPLAAYEGLQQLDRIIASPAELAPEREIEMLPVCSSMAAKVGYDNDREILEIEFNSGSVYQYSAVEPEIWECLRSTDSIGEFYNDAIKGYYPSERIG